MQAHESADALDEIQSRAQSEAQRLFGEGPVAAWDAAPAAGPPTRRRWMLVASIVVGIVGLGLAATIAWREESAAAVVEVAPAWPAPPADIDDTPNVTPPTADAGSARSAQAVAPALVVDRRQGLWTIEAVNASRLDAAERLAQLSGVPLPAAAALLADTSPLELHWRGRELAEAWQAVIGPELNFALQCRVQQCRLWILGRAQAPSVPPARDVEVDPALPPSRTDDGAVVDIGPVTPPPVEERLHG